MDCQLSNVTKNYLSAFYCILDEMIQGMTQAEKADSISYNFIVQMIPHHRGAIEMSKNILNYTTNVPLQKIAENIIEEQTKSIENMQKIQQCCLKETSTEQDLALYQRKMMQIMDTMFCEMDTAPSNNQVNCNFLWEMIPHHRGAVRMSETTLQYQICSGLKPILEAIISSQENGIAQMQQLLRCIGCRVR